MQKNYDVDCELNYQVGMPTTFLFKIEVAQVPGQLILSERLVTVPELPLERHTDALGNRTLRINVPVGPFSIRYTAAVQLHPEPAAHDLPECEVHQIPLDVLPFLAGSRYVESELLFDDTLRLIGSEARGHARVQRICDWVRDNVAYAVGTSLPQGTACDTFRHRTGVCRDHAHLAMAMCRAMNIPARFVVGHVIWDTPPPDFHALFEAWLGGRWVLFDPTGMVDTADMIRIGTGVDASALPFATLFGQAFMQRMSPLVHVSPAEDEHGRAA